MRLRGLEETGDAPSRLSWVRQTRLLVRIRSTLRSFLRPTGASLVRPFLQFRTFRHRSIWSAKPTVGALVNGAFLAQANQDHLAACRAAAAELAAPCEIDTCPPLSGVRGPCETARLLAILASGLLASVGLRPTNCTAARLRGGRHAWIFLGCAQLEVASASIDSAIGLLASGLVGRPLDIAAAVEGVRGVALALQVDPWSSMVMDVAVARGIPAERVGVSTVIQLGTGCRQVLVDTAVPLDNQAAHIAAADVVGTRTRLAEFGMSTLPAAWVTGHLAAEALIRRVGTPAIGIARTASGSWDEIYRVRTEDQLSKLAEEPRAHSPHVVARTADRYRDVLVWQGKVLRPLLEARDAPPSPDVSTGIAERAVVSLGLTCGVVSLVDDAEAGEPTIAAVRGGFAMCQELSRRPAVARTCAGDVIAHALPNGSEGRVPVIAVTGTNGKTTTTRMIAYVLKAAGFRVGFKVSDGIYIDDHLLEGGDAHSHHPAKRLLRSSAVDVVVLELARGDLLRRGLALDMIDVAVVLNVAEDHLGEEGVLSLRDLAYVKGLVVDALDPRGSVVLNAEDPHVRALRTRTSAPATWIAASGAGGAHRLDGPLVTVVDGAFVFVESDGTPEAVVGVSEVPLTLGGKAEFVFENVLAAIAACRALGVGSAVIKEALVCARPLHRAFPGRLNTFTVSGAIVIVDQAHNSHAVQKLLDMTQELGDGRRIGVLAMAGDRTDEHIIRTGQLAARRLDVAVVREQHELRGRRRGEVAGLLAAGLRNGGMKPQQIRTILDEKAAVANAVDEARDGDVVVALATKDIVGVTKELLARPCSGPASF